MNETNNDDQMMVTITKEEYRNLRYTERKLQLLECGGVDNWEWYEESLADLEDKEDFE